MVQMNLIWYNIASLNIILVLQMEVVTQLIPNKQLHWFLTLSELFVHIIFYYAQNRWKVLVIVTNQYCKWCGNETTAQRYIHKLIHHCLPFAFDVVLTFCDWINISQQNITSAFSCFSVRGWLTNKLNFKCEDTQQS